LTVNTHDNRSQKVVVCCHCVLNQNAKLESIAGWPGVINEVVEVMLKSGVGILQMECPEMIYEGIGRFDKSVEQYDCSSFRRLCRKIAGRTVDQIDNYQKWGYKVAAILAIDGSPSCGYNLSQSAPEWRGQVAGRSWEKPRYIARKGILFEEIDPLLENLPAPVSVIGIPEIPELGKLDAAIENLKKALE
jgi:predicted secreted protein